MKTLSLSVLFFICLLSVSDATDCYKTATIGGKCPSGCSKQYPAYRYGGPAICVCCKPVSIPEPGTGNLLAAGAFGLAGLVLMKRKSTFPGKG